jgi:hypothetical protein
VAQRFSAVITRRFSIAILSEHERTRVRVEESFRSRTRVPGRATHTSLHRKSQVIFLKRNQVPGRRSRPCVGRADPSTPPSESSAGTDDMTKTESDKRRLYICPLEIYDGICTLGDGTLGELPRIGVKSWYSDTLLKNITASLISDHLGSKSLDYVRKRYLNNWKRHADLDPNAFDLKTIHFLDICIHELQEYLVANSHNLIYSEIQTISDMTLAKGLGTLRVALDLSSKGLLHEVLTLCRSSLEMISWAFAIFDLPDKKDIFEILPEKTISGFKSYFPYAGKYYGYLSGFLHWRKETHTRAFDFEEEYIAVVYASGRNKWEAVANVMLMTQLYAEGYAKKYAALKCKPSGKHCLPEIREVSQKVAKKQKQWLKFLAGLEGQHLSESFVDVLASAHAS